MKTQRLKRLADLLEAYQGDGLPFNLEGWAQVRVIRTGHLWWKKETFCNTTACAVGLACLSGAFFIDGLRYSIDRDGLYPVFDGLKNYPAVQKFFGITENQAFHLFSSEKCGGPTQGVAAAHAVASRIRKMIAKRDQKRTKKTTAAVEQIKRRALEPVA